MAYTAYCTKARFCSSDNDESETADDVDVFEVLLASVFVLVVGRRDDACVEDRRACVDDDTVLGVVLAVVGTGVFLITFPLECTKFWAWVEYTVVVG